MEISCSGSSIIWRLKAYLPQLPCHVRIHAFRLPRLFQGDEACKAERILKLRKESIARLTKFFIVEEKKPFRTLIDEVVVNERYEIEYFTKPKDERLRGIYEEWNLYRFRKTKDRKYLLKILGWPEPKINLEWPYYTYEGEKRDITDLPLGYLMGPPKRDKAPWEL